MPMQDCLIGVGSNLGDRRQILDDAVAQIAARVNVTATSDWFTYAAVGGPESQQDFLNGVVRVETDLPADTLTAFLREVEKSSGRERIERWSSRTLDCDLLFYGQHFIETPDLQVPHPRLITRRFVLEPAASIAPDFRHPRNGWTIHRLFRHLLDARPHFSVIGTDSNLAGRIVDAMVKQFAALRLPPPAGWSDYHIQSDRVAIELALAEVKTGLQTWDGTLPLVSSFWFLQPWMQAFQTGTDRTGAESANAAIPAPPMELLHLVSPKLLIVTDAVDSPMGSQLSKVPAELRIPTLHLSQLEKHAIQDALGAVAAMQ